MNQEVAAKVDTELMRQLEDEAAGEEPLVAVVRLHPDDPSQIVPTPERTEQLTQQVLQRVRKHVGTAEDRHNVFKNLGYFVVCADKPFMRELLSQPEVARAAANVQPGSALIPPVNKRPVPEISQESSSGGARKARPAKASRKAAGRAKK